jgi:hypothetical protein
LADMGLFNPQKIRKPVSRTSRVGGKRASASMTLNPLTTGEFVESLSRFDLRVAPSEAYPPLAWMNEPRITKSCNECRERRRWPTPAECDVSARSQCIPHFTPPVCPLHNVRPTSGCDCTRRPEDLSLSVQARTAHCSSVRVPPRGVCFGNPTLGEPKNAIDF